MKARTLEAELPPWRRFMGVAQHYFREMDAFLVAEISLSLLGTYLLFHVRDAEDRLRTTGKFPSSRPTDARLTPRRSFPHSKGTRTTGALR